MTRKPNWQEDPIDRKTRVIRRHNSQHPNDKKNQVTKRPKWQEHPKLQQEQEEPNNKKTQVATRPTKTHLVRRVSGGKAYTILTDRTLTDGHPLICWISILKDLELYYISNQEDNNTSTTSWSIPQ